ncbi:hypothetical protein [Ekhidna sp.]|uniref:hypothetical protein n=1 Tax=Ekhidna sp. TaxID=2608089 RepID=UPI003C7C1149
MAHNELSEKLDQLSSHELGVEFDDVATWSRLEKRLDERRPYAIWWVAAACLILGLAYILSPTLEQSERQVLSDQSIAADSKEDVETPAIIEEQVSPSVAVDEEFDYPDAKPLRKKGIAPLQVASLPSMNLSLEPVVVPVKHENKKSLFAAEDISAIRASLEQPTVEKGRSITIRAQWQKSTDELNVNYQALKIKLYEKNK